MPTNTFRPGEYPFTRGIHPDMYKSRPWTMRQYAGFGSAEESNARYRYLLEQGTMGLSVAFDLPTQLGLDPDDALARGEVGRVGVDWVGNDIIVDSIADPKVQGVTCHVAYFERSFFDRLQQGNWFEDPSYSAVDCVQTGPVIVGDIDTSPEGEDVFRERQSLIFKTLRVTRIWDEASGTLIYLAHASQVTQGSGKMSLTSIPVPPEGRPAR